MAESIDSFSDLKEIGVDFDNNELDNEFSRAADHLPKLLNVLDDETLLTLYAYYKQAREGVCNVAKPSWFDFKGKAKWLAWKKLENMPQNEAKLLYVQTIKKLDQNYDATSSKEKSNWVCVSTLQNINLNETDKNIVDFIKENNREEVMKWFSTENDKLINELDENGLALIHWASDAGSSEIISDLLKHGADINKRDSDGQTALHYSSSCGHLECARFLLSEGASIVRDNDGLTPLDVANDNAMKELLDLPL